jgi:hypothetical protein
VSPAEEVAAVNPEGAVPAAADSLAATAATDASDAHEERLVNESKTTKGGDIAEALGNQAHSSGGVVLRRRRSEQPFKWRLKTKAEYERDSMKKALLNKKYFDFKSLEQMVELVPHRHQQVGTSEREEENQRRLCLVSFLTGVLNLNPEERWTPYQALRHNFVTDGVHNASFKPPKDETVGVRIPLPARLLPEGTAADSAGTFSSTSEAGSTNSGFLGCKRKSTYPRAKAPSVGSAPTSASSPHGSTASRSSAAPGFGLPPNGYQAQSQVSSSPWHLPSLGYSASECSGGETRPPTWGGSRSGSQGNFESDPLQSDGSFTGRAGQHSDSDSTGPMTFLKTHGNTTRGRRESKGQ